jgi:hypothetical protein
LQLPSKNDPQVPVGVPYELKSVLLKTEPAGAVSVATPPSGTVTQLNPTYLEPIVILNALLTAKPRVFVALTVKSKTVELKSPTPVAIPLISPVDASIDIPPGKDPLEIE